MSVPLQASDQAINEWLIKNTDWQIVNIQHVKQLQREYRFDNFIEALTFAQKIGNLAEKYNHHPAILIEWGKCQLNWWTHSIQGIDENDFILAAKSDKLFISKS